MNREKLYKIIDIEEPSDFQYFENLAALLETDEEMDFEEIADLVAKIDKDTLAGLIDDYFNDITNNIPENDATLFTTLDNIKRSLVGMARNVTDDSVISKLAEEIERFRNWYNVDCRVFIKDLDTLEEYDLCMRDALAETRIEKLDNKTYQYDFSDMIEYDLDEYVMSFGDIIALAEDEI